MDNLFLFPESDDDDDEIKKRFLDNCNAIEKEIALHAQ